ncbi:AAA family ATPase [Cellulosimicrobium arenosum]|uniref:MinD-like ATPase involved in chromosome partitioning or flagellar assembly n=1 Tax=Cellulosimicrobium arenosum TaxID=2708133 RepID=A0A927J2I9_9MICO|nr:hypothetical protein [Cellulosimicrobium arenosum]MBD8080708.1 hypothetical protein [Cellulosimicrobium arenosum]
MAGATAVATVLCAVRGPGEAGVVTALDAPGSGLQVTRRCADVVELLAAAAAGAGRVAVVSADLPSLDRDAIAHLHAHAVRVVAIAGQPWERDMLVTLGVDTVVDLSAPAAGLRDAVRDTARGASAAPGGPALPPTAPQESALGSQAPRDGRLVAVWGPTGAPGRTTLAVNLAAELSGPRAPGRRPRRARRAVSEVDLPATAPRGPEADVVLVDADTYGGTIAQRLGLLDESPGLAAAARGAAQGMLSAATLARLTPVVAPRLRVLTGIARAARWPELPGPSLDAVWDVTRTLADWTVVDCGFCVERDELLSYDTRAPQRNGATLSALSAADAVVVVGSADPVGLQRLVRSLDELADSGVALSAERVVVVNRVRAAVVGPRPESAVRLAMERYAGVADLFVVPEDGALDVALREGRTLPEVSPSGSARRAVARVAEHLREVVPARPAPGSAARSLEAAH